MLLYHRSPAGPAIVTGGFLDGEGSYFTSEVWRGVWLSDRVLDENEGAQGDDIVAVEVPEEAIVDYEWVQEGSTYREWLVPADLLNRFPRHLLTEDELASVDDPRWLP